MKPFIMTLTGPTCAGKSTLEDYLMQEGFAGVISTTTRAPRFGEKDGEDYYFTDPDSFEQAVSEGHFVEAVEFNGNRYGVTKSEVERITAQGKPIVVVCEPNGRDQIKSYCEKHGWDYYAAFVNAAPELIAQRFITRLMDDERSLFNQKKLIDTYASRLALMLAKERAWILDAYFSPGNADYIISNFTEDTTNSIIEYLTSVAKRYGYLRAVA
jgi:guanylate kinase